MRYTQENEDNLILEDLDARIRNWELLNQFEKETKEELDKKADIGYVDEQLSNLPTPETPAWNKIQGKPSQFNPTQHSHDIDDIEGLRDELNPELIKENIGLDNVDNVKQAGKVEFDAHLADGVSHIKFGTATGENAKITTLDPAPSAYVDGMAVSFKNTSQNNGTVTLNVNGLGAKSIVKPNGNALSSGNLKADSIYTVRYNATTENFILQGDGGEYGTALASDVLTGKTIGTEEGIINGSMSNRGKVSNTITTQNGIYTVPEGYHDGAGQVKANFTNLIASNVKSGVNIGGVVGALTPSPPVVYSQSNVLRSISLSAPYSYDTEVTAGRIKVNLAGTYYMKFFFRHSSTGSPGKMRVTRGSSTIATVGKATGNIYDSNYGELYKDITLSSGDILTVFYKGGSGNITISFYADNNTIAEII